MAHGDEGSRMTPEAWRGGGVGGETSLCGVPDKLPRREPIWDSECEGWEVSGGRFLRSWFLLEGGWSLL